MSGDEDDLKERVKRASAIAREAPEGLREAAFKAVFEELSHATTTQLAAPTRRRPSRPASTGEGESIRALASRRKAGTAGPKAAILTLIDEGFFDEGRSVPAIRDQLSASKGRHFEPRRIATAVLRLLRDGVLARTASNDGYVYKRAKSG